MKGFTLIELLIVVAIIAILAAIAVPNFLEAQTRAKLSRAQSDLRTIATALEQYRTDNNAYPICAKAGNPGYPTIKPAWKRLIPLTTPVSYLSYVPLDPFYGGSDNSYNYAEKASMLFIRVGIWDKFEPYKWYMVSKGPDKDLDYHRVIYDSSNGTVSNGDIYRYGP